MCVAVRLPADSALMDKSVLVIAAHPDDEVLGCGGTLSRHELEGDTVNLLFLSDGVSSRIGTEQYEIKKRSTAALNSSKILKITGEITFLDFPDNRLDGVLLLDIVKAIEIIVSRLNPTIVYTHHASDLNIDHKVTHAAVMTACRPLPEQCVKEVYAFEVLSSTEWGTTCHSPFIPNHFVDISKFLNQKIEALKEYADEIRFPPHSRNLKHVRLLAEHRGNCVGVEAAEAFMVLRTVR